MYCDTGWRFSAFVGFVCAALRWFWCFWFWLGLFGWVGCVVAFGFGWVCWFFLVLIYCDLRWRDWLSLGVWLPCFDVFCGFRP